MFYKILKDISEEVKKTYAADAVVIGISSDGTYDIRLRTGAVKRRVKNISGQSFAINTSVTVLLPHGKFSHVRILGRGISSTKDIKTISV